MQKHGPTVGASLLAKNVNDNACFLTKRGAYEFFASKLAPTVGEGKPPQAISFSSCRACRFYQMPLPAHG
ncbi:hypothetical protein CER19_19135 [Pseudomonas sp. GL93]|nr:hypothetical protein CER19_19135 [Pseudomonas sp. GL93]